MGSNFSQKALTSVACSITFMGSVSAQFDCQYKITSEISAHDDVDDVKHVIGVSNVTIGGLHYNPNNQHTT